MDTSLTTAISPAQVPLGLPARALRWRPLLHVLMVLWLALSYWVAVKLPQSIGWENSWLENAQVAILMAGMIIALHFARTEAEAGADRAVVALAVSLIPLWCILVARELSWGATYLAPLEFSEKGPVFSSSVLWYKPAVYPVVGLAVAFSAYVFLRYRADRIMVRCMRSSHFVWPELAFVVFAALISTYAEGRLGIPVAHALVGHTVVMEEWAEVIVYLALAVGQGHIFMLLRCQASPAR